MNQTIDPGYATAVFNRQCASFKATMQQYHAVQREIDQLLSRSATDPQARRMVASVEQDIQRSGAQRAVSMQQILKAESAFAKLEDDFSKRFAVATPAANDQVLMKKTAMKKHRSFV